MGVCQETKNKGGVGAVVGEVEIGRVYAPNYVKRQGASEDNIEHFAMTRCAYLDWCKMQGIKPDMNEGWLKSKLFDEYAKSIGMYGQNYNYALSLLKPIRYAQPKPLKEFLNTKGDPMQRPPQNMCWAQLDYMHRRKRA